MNKELVEPDNGPHVTRAAFREYLTYLQANTRVQVKPPSSTIPILEDDSDREDPYDEITRKGVDPQQAPVENYMVSNHFDKCLTKCEN
jgi:hypothetical protein